jgi:peptidoglycan/LPS O-acetylase OafA/YrhL
VLILHTFAGPDPIGLVCKAGWIGVDLFFVLSGFLITRILLEARARPCYFTNFYARRALRIWPIYYFVLLFFWLAPRAFPSLEVPLTPSGWVAHALYVQNLADSTRFGPWPLSITWSLAIEEQFYVLWPLLVFVLGDRPLRWLLAALIVAVPILRLALLSTRTIAPITAYVATPFRIDTLAIGGLVSIVVGAGGPSPTLRRLARCGSPLALLASAVMIGLLGGDRLVVTERPVQTLAAFELAFLYTLLALGFAGIIVLILDGEPTFLTRVFNNVVLRHLGRVSYGVYLYHGIVFVYCRSVLWPILRENVHLQHRTQTALGILLNYAILFVITHLSWYGIERPLLRLKSRFQ